MLSAAGVTLWSVLRKACSNPPTPSPPVGVVAGAGHRCACSCRSVGKSNSSVSGSSVSLPSRDVSRLRNSTTPSESSPASISGASADTPGSSSSATCCTSVVDVSFRPVQAVDVVHVVPPTSMLPSNFEKDVVQSPAWRVPRMTARVRASCRCSRCAYSQGIPCSKM